MVPSFSVSDCDLSSEGIKDSDSARGSSSTSLPSPSSSSSSSSASSLSSPSPSVMSSPNSLFAPPGAAGPRMSLKKPATASSLSVPTPGGVFPLPNSQQLAGGGSATGNPRNKVGLKPGFSLMDWIRLTKSGKDLTGTGGKLLKVTKAELKKHRTRKDAWMAINGKVYNVTQYMDYHPGGWDELVRGAGIDATDLFNEVHRWVNYESMLAACLVGKLVDDNDMVTPPPPSNSVPNSAGFVKPAPKPVIPPIQPKVQVPTMDSYQTDSTFVLSIFTKRPSVSKADVIAEILEQNKFRCVIRFHGPEHHAFSVKMTLAEKASMKSSSVKISKTTGKVELTFDKLEVGKKWACLSDKVDENFCKQSDLDLQYRNWTLADRVKVTHDVDQITLEPPTDNQGFHFFVPVGHHVNLKGEIEDIELIRSYTPVWNGLEPDLADDGRLHFLIKTYPDGAFTPLLQKMEVGQTIPVSDHTGEFNPDQVKGLSQLILLPAGTGFTPMTKLTQSFLNNSQSKIGASMIFFNKTPDDIMWRDKLESLASANEAFKIHNVLSKSPDWPGEKGRISKELLERLLPEKEGNDEAKRLVGICGPIPYTREAKRILKELNFADSEIFVFEG